ncbi:type III effector HrpK domain-containing protein [Burkholderia oklahomensis]|uniref:type III effector HrpK domain-containing protein n=1 Tax=Burkholderia oklahomensis TaxID=342113 RepID=UPI00264F2A6B|nr:type III effector HrpK domain-containing protein [Burkholderia oklahomensis]MDN7672111.1 type III effector HrpK domain-containing protein [Burkholderia oklahomensis]
MTTSPILATNRQCVDLTGYDSTDAPGPGTAALQSVETQLHQLLRDLMARQLQGGVATAQRQNIDVRAGAANGAARYVPLDDYAGQYDRADLGRWSDLAAPGQGVSLERPFAAMQILAGVAGPSGRKPSEAQNAAALQFVEDNPSLKTAMRNIGALKADGGIDPEKVGHLLREVEANLTLADDNVKTYLKNHPNASRDALDTVRAAALLQAYDPIAGESAGHQSNGKNNSYSGGKNGGGLTTKQQVADLQNNEGFSSALKSAAKAWSTSGAFDALDRSGDDKAIEKADGIFSANNLSHFITNDAPASEASDQQFLKRASLENITAGTDISKLDQDIFALPQRYSPQQKAAVMVKLMETLVDVQAGGADKLRDVTATAAALKRDILTLANDPATSAYLQQTVPPAMQSLNATFERAGGLVGGPGAEIASVVGGNCANQVDARNVVNQVHDRLDDARNAAKRLGKLAESDGSEAASVAESATDGTESTVAGAAEGAGETATCAADGAEGAVAGVADGVEGAVAGAEGAVAGAEAGAGAAEGVMGAVAGGLAAAAPVLAAGAAIAGIAGIVMAIVEAVKKHQNQSAFAANVNPTLNQFGIPLPK